MHTKFERLLSKSLATLEVMTYYLVVHTGPEQQVVNSVFNDGRLGGLIASCRVVSFQTLVFLLEEGWFILFEHGDGKTAGATSDKTTVGAPAYCRAEQRNVALRGFSRK